MENIRLETATNLEERQWRGNIYAMLGNLFARPPTPDILELILALRCAEKYRNFTPIVQSFRLLRQAAKSRNTDKIREEYHQLFIGLTGGEIIPYASWYLTGFLMEKPLAILRADLKKIGIERQMQNPEPEDHIAALFEAMSLLVQDHNPLQVEFFNSHIKSWIDRFFVDLNLSKTADFYRAAGAFGDAFVHLDKEYLERM